MPTKTNRYGRNTLGIRGRFLILKAVAYTAQADYKSFVASAVDGELGIFEDTAAMLVVPNNALLSVTKKVFIAMKRSATEESIEKIDVFRVTDFKVTYTAYVAPVKQVTTVVLGEGGTASAVIQDLTYTSKNPGTAANAITVTNVVAGNSTALSVTVSGNDITINIATNGGGAATSTATQVKTAYDLVAAAVALASVAITGTAATVQVAQGKTNLQGGTDSALMVKNKRFALTILDKTPGYQPFPTYMYEVQAKAGESYDGAATRLVAEINSTTSVYNKNRDRIVTATYVAATNTITLTAIDFGTTFNVVLPPDTAMNETSVVTYGTAMKIGSGTPDQVKKYEEANKVGYGIGTMYPAQGTVPSDYNNYTSYVSDSETYDTFNFSGFRDEVSKTNHHRQYLISNFGIISPLSGTNPTAGIKTTFGF